MLSKKLRQLMKKQKRRQTRSTRNKLTGIEGLQDRVVMATNVLAEVAADSTVGPIQEEVTTLSAPAVSARIVNGTPTSDFPSVGLVGDNSGSFCSGTLISPSHVLTAGHCAIGVGNTQGRFIVGGQTYSTDRVFVHPQYNDNTLNNDIAIYSLSSSVSNVTPSAINRVTPVVGQTLTLVGFGAGGSGSSGHNGDFGTKRVGTTPIDSVTSTLITWNFDNNSESNTAPGDSGGPAFLQQNGAFYVAGVTSGGDSPNAGIGDHSFDTRVDAYASWIDSIVGTTPNPDPSPDPNPIPSPDPTPDPIPDPNPTGDDHVDQPGAGASLLALNPAGTGSSSGSLEEVGDRDVFQIMVSETGTATVTTTATQDLDTYLRVFNSNGELVAQNDDFGGTLNSQATLDVNPGVYYLSVGSYADSEAGDYDVHVQVVANDSNPLPDAEIIELNSEGRGRANGEITAGEESDLYGFTANLSGSMIIRAVGRSGDIDTMLTIYDGRGNEVAFNDDYRGRTDSRVRLDVRVGESYTVEVSSWGDTTGDYRLNLRTRATRTADSDARIVNGQVTGDFKAVGIVNDGCSGTLISPTHVLTAAHCVEGVSDTRGTFEVNGQTYQTVRVVTHPGYNPNNFDSGHDIAIMELSRPVTGIQPNEILREAPQVGQTLKLVGYGEGGTSTGGSEYDFGTLRVGETTLDEVSSLQIAWNFDSHNESNTAPGDSGGPAYVEVDGKLYIAGITSGGDGDPHRLGDYSFDTRVDAYASWIDSVVGSTTPTPSPNPDPAPTPDPDPNPVPTPAPTPEPIEEFVNAEVDGDVFSNKIGSDAALIQIGQDGVGFVDGFINHSGDVDVFQFELSAADLVYVDLFSWNGDLDTKLQVFDQDGMIVSDNNDSFGSTDSSLTLELEAGSYYVIASSTDSSTGEYGLDVSTTGAEFGDFGGDPIVIDDAPIDVGNDDEWFNEDDEWFDGDDDWFFEDGFDDSSGDDVWMDDPWLADGFGDEFGNADDWFSEDVDDPFDVNEDGSYSALDVLQVINYLNDPFGQRASGEVSAAERFDVNGDGSVSAVDALMLINKLNSPNDARGATENQAASVVKAPQVASPSEISDGSTKTVLTSQSTRHGLVSGGTNSPETSNCGSHDDFDMPWFGSDDPFAEADDWLA